MTLKICPCIGCVAHQGSCPNPVEKGRCPRCARVVRQRRGTTTQQGYGWQHQQRRTAMLPAAIGKPCPRCGRPMTKASEIDAAHTIAKAIDPNSVADDMWCSHCNRSEGGKLGRQAQQ